MQNVVRMEEVTQISRLEVTLVFYKDSCYDEN